MTYYPSPQATPLDALRVDVEAEVSNSHPTMQAGMRRSCEAHNRAIDLMMGAGEFESAYGLAEAATPPDGGQPDVMVESLCIELRSKQRPTMRLDEGLVMDRLQRLIMLAPDHPVARNWRVLHVRTYPFWDSPPPWLL